MTTSAKRIKANRRNARKSTGPRTAAGKARSRMNAITHGLDAETFILPGEDGAGFQARLDAWKAEFPPRCPLEDAMLEQAARLSWRSDRADRAQAAYLAGRLALEQDGQDRRRAEAAAEAERIGRRLIDGPPPGTVAAIPDLHDQLVERRREAPIPPNDPEHPERLRLRLEASAEGCRWLLGHWAELRAALDAGDDDQALWGPDQRLRAVRLLARQPLDAVDDPSVQAIYLAAFVLESHNPAVFDDQAAELTTREFASFLERLAARRVSERLPTSREAARVGLLCLVQSVIDGLEARAAAHAARAERAAAMAPGQLAFDDDPQGVRLRRVQQRIVRAMLRTLDRLLTLRSRPVAPVRTTDRTRNVAASPELPEVYEKIRNEPNAPVPGAEEAPPAPTGPTLAPRPAADAAPVRVPRRNSGTANALRKDTERTQRRDGGGTVPRRSGFPA